MSYRSRSIRGSLAVFGVALGLIGTTGAASAQEAPPAAGESSYHTEADAEAEVGASSAQEGDATVGEPLVLERPAPRPNPANELRATPAPVTAPAPATEPASSVALPVAPNGAVSVPFAATATEPVAAASIAPNRPTQVQGVQIERPLVESLDTSSLARTGVDNHGLLVVAAALLLLGSVMIRSARPRRTL